MKLIVVALFLSLMAKGQATTAKFTVEEYIETYKDIAISEMRRTGIPASITLAQGILESHYGNSYLAIYANNHFGIKCHDWTGKRVYKDDDEKKECFRKYASPEESYRDHSEFLTTRQRYADLFKLEPDDYKGWAHGLKKAGYATNPHYARKLIDLIDKYKLHYYDQIGLGLVADNNSVREDISGESALAVNPEARVFEHNRIKTIIVQEGETLLSIANTFDIRVSRLLKYNDLSEHDRIYPGMYIYLQPKRRKGAHKSHVVKAGESLYDISQIEGIKLKHLCRKNLLNYGEEPATGEVLFLRKKRKSPPKLKTREELKQLMVQRLERTIDVDGTKNQKQENKTPENVEVKLSESDRTTVKEPPQNNNSNTSYNDSKTETYVNIGNVKVNTKSDHYVQNENTGSERNQVEGSEEESAAIIYTPAKKVHIVEAGESLYSIGRQYGLSVEELLALNDLPSTDIKAGMVLKIAPETENIQVEKASLPSNQGMHNAVAVQQNSGDTIHVVQPYQTLYYISVKYGVTVEDIMRWNNLKTQDVKAGQKLLIKRTDKSAGVSPNVKPSPEASTNVTNDDEQSFLEYQVKEGDTFYSVARKFGVSVEELRAFNHKEELTLKIGETLKIPRQHQPQGNELPKPEQNNEIKYIVKPGDTLYSIAKKFNTTVEALKAWNNLEGYNISIGDTLLIKQ